MDFMDFSRRLYRWASEGVDMYELSSCILLKIPQFGLAKQARYLLDSTEPCVVQS